MIIKYLKSKEIEKGGYEFIQIAGEKADGTAYTKDFPAWDEELVAALDEFAPGEFLNLSYKNDKYKNLKGIKGADGFGAAAKQKSKSNPKKSDSGGTDNGNFRGMDTNRSAAMYLAKEVVERSLGKKGITAKEYASKILGTADILLMYLLEGRNVIKEETVKDGLEVPDIDDNDSTEEE